jgi:pleckstrin homology domain-containing family G member 5
VCLLKVEIFFPSLSLFGFPIFFSREVDLFLKFKVHPFVCQPYLTPLSNNNTTLIKKLRREKDFSIVDLDFHSFFTSYFFHFSQVIRQPFLTDRLIVKLKEKENTLQCVYLNEFNMAIGAFILQCNEAKNWYDGINKARHIYMKLKQDSHESHHSISRHHSIVNNNTTSDSLSIRKSPLGSSIGMLLMLFKMTLYLTTISKNKNLFLSTVSSLNNSNSGSVEFNESKTVSVDFEKTNSISSDEGSYSMHNKAHTGSGSNRKVRQISSNSLTVQSYSTHLNQSMPNLASGPYHINSNNTLLVPSAQKSHSAHSSHSGNLLSPSQRGISYPPPSPNR